MSNRASDVVLRELGFLAALDNVQAKVDTSVIAEIQDLSGAVVGAFYGAIVKQPSRGIMRPLELPTVVSQPVAFSVRPSSPHISFEGMVYARATDSQLVSSLFQDDVTAWQEFVRRFQPLIEGTIFKAVRRKGDVSPALVEDLVQEVFLKLCGRDSHILESLDLRHDKSLPRLLTVIASNVAQGYFRSAASVKQGTATEDDKSRKGLPLIESRDLSSAIEKGVLLKEIDQLLQAFSERDRKVFWLHYRSGLNAKAISQMQGVGLTVKGTESLLSRMRRHIWEHLASPVSERQKGTEP